MRKLLKLIKNHLRPKKILFADLDGTIIVTRSGEIFPKDYNDWQFKKDIINAIKEYNPTHLHIISNQGGIEKGFVDKTEFEIKMKNIKWELHSCLPNIIISYDYCISNDPTNYYRKPHCGMIKSYYSINYNTTNCNKYKTLMIGDASGLSGQFSDSDKKCAENANIEYMDVDAFINKYVYK